MIQGKDSDVPDRNHEGLQELASNRTLLVQKFTAKPPLVPEVVVGLETLQDVFNHFKPHIQIAFKEQQGQLISETIDFKCLADFSPERITSKSTFMRGLELRKTNCFEILKTLNTDESLQTIIEDANKKEVLLHKIKALKLQLTNKETR